MICSSLNCFRFMEFSLVNYYGKTHPAGGPFYWGEVKEKIGHVGTKVDEKALERWEVKLPGCRRFLENFFTT